MSLVTAEHRACDHAYDPVWTWAKTKHICTKQANFSPLDISGTERFKYFTVASTRRSWSLLSPTRHPILPESQTNEVLKRNIHKPRKVNVMYCNNGTQTEFTSPHIAHQDINLMEREYDEKQVQQEIALARKEREREKREEEAALPPLTEESSIEIYRAFLEEDEKKKFALREKEIDHLMKHKLNTFQQNLLSKYATNEAIKEFRIKISQESKNISFNDKILKLKQKRRNRASRKQLHTYNNEHGNPVSTYLNKWENTKNLSITSNKEILSLLSDAHRDGLQIRQNKILFRAPIPKSSYSDANRKAKCLTEDLELISTKFEDQDRIPPVGKTNIDSTLSANRLQRTPRKRVDDSKIVEPKKKNSKLVTFCEKIANELHKS